MGKVRIGISGWRYPPWRGSFYPNDLPQRAELEFASSQFRSIELNGSFYSLQRPASFAKWAEQTPADFVFSIKGGRFLTHILRLREPAQALANFFAQGLFELGPKLGPFLWQFPPSLRYDEALFDAFFRLLPKTTGTAAKLAAGHNAKMKGRAQLAYDRSRRLRHAVEVRHPSFENESFIRLLRRHRIAIVVADTAGRWPYVEDLTSDFVYLRLHGDEDLYANGYTDAALDRWARRIDAWRNGRQPRDAKLVAPRLPAPPARKSRDVFCYFDNDVKVHAPHDAHALMLRLGLIEAKDALPRTPARARAAIPRGRRTTPEGSRRAAAPRASGSDPRRREPAVRSPR